MKSPSYLRRFVIPLILAAAALAVIWGALVARAGANAFERAPQPEIVSISGTVYSAEPMMLPIDGAMISGGGMVAYSDPSGAYTLTLPAGTTWVDASASAYGGPGQAVTLAEGEQRLGVDFFLHPLDATISGVVRDSSTGLPLAGVDVAANVLFWSNHYTTNATGAFTISVYADQWYVNATKAGYASAASNITVNSGDHAGGVDLALNPVTAWIRGTARRGDGFPVPFLNVWANHLHRASGSTGTSADANGQYTIGVTAGNFSVQFGPESNTMSGTPIVNLIDGQTALGVDLTLLTNTVTVTGRIVDNFGNPVDGAHVEPRDPSSGHWLSWGTDSGATGYYTLPLPAGTWQIAASRDGYVSPSNQTISVSDGAPLSGVDFTLRLLDSTILGTVRDASTNLPLAGATVDVWLWPDGGWGTRTTADASGAYTVSVWGDTWRLAASAAEHLRSSQTVAVADGEDRSGVDFALTPASSRINGTLRISGGGTLANQWVDAWSNSGLESWAEADATGVYTSWVTAGEWTLHSRLQNHTLQQTPRVTIGDGWTIGGIDLIFLPNEANVVGHVRDQNGAAVGGARVRADDAGTGAPVTNDVYAGASGAYTLPVAAGTWQLRAEKEGYVEARQTFTITPGETATIDPVLRALNATIRGTVRDGNNLPLAGVNVGTGIPGWGTNATTDSSGNYTLTVYGGTWWVWASRDGHTGAGQWVTIADNEERTGIDFTLHALNATIQGTVRDASTNAAIAGAAVSTGNPQWGTSVTADASGAYTMSVYSGTWWVNASAQGYLQSGQSVTAADGGSATQDFSLTPAHSTITGTVYYSGGAPVANWWVHGDEPSSGASNHVNLDASGRYTMSVTPGTWTLYSRLDEYTLQSTQRLTIGDYQTVGGIDLIFLPNDATVMGQVRNESGNELPGVRITGLDNNTGWPVTQDVFSDPSGYYTMSIAAGTWRLKADAGLGYPGATQTITPTHGQILMPVDFVLAALDVTIRGTVRDNHGVPVAGANVGTGGPGWGSNAATDASGAYTLTAVAGTWNVHASKQGYTSANQSITASSGQTLTGIDFTLNALNATIHGTVRDASTNTGIPGASVSTGNPQWGTSVTADASGAYTMNVFAGTWSVSASAPGYLKSTQSVTVDDGGSATLDFSLTPAHSLITGTALYTDGVTIPNAWVSACASLCTSTRTDASGVYSISVTPGTWTLSGSRSGYTLRETPRVTIGDYETIGGIDLVYLANDAWIVGHVRAVGGAAIPNARVCGTDAAAGFCVTNNVYADASGAYTLPIAAGTWQAFAAAQGYLNATQVVTLTSGQTATVDLYLQALDVTIRGTVRDNQGLPLAGANVNVGGPGWGTSATTDSSGAYTLTAVAGTWNVSASKQGYTSANRSITASSGQTLTGIDLTLNSLNATIQGTVRDASTNVSIAGANVKTGNPQWGTNVTTDATGSYTLTVYSGTWSVSVSAAGYLPATQSVAVGDGGAATLDFSLTPAHSLITGTVTYGGGTPVTNRWISACPSSGSCTGATTDATGVYSAWVTPGTWTVYSSMTGYTLRETRRVVIGDYQTIGGIDLVFLANDAAVIGHVLDQNGAPVAGARARAEDALNGYRVTPDVYADASGAYTLPIAGGTWRLVAEQTGYVRATQLITVTQGQTLTVDMVLQVLDVTIRGTVRDSHGLPLAGANVNVGGPGWGTSATTDSSGAYTLTALAGTWNVRASKAGYSSASQSITASSGETLTGIDLTLNVLNATIQGSVRDASTNAAIAGAYVSTGAPSWGTSATTDVSGTYTLTVYSGTWSVKASAAGYLPTSLSVSVGDGGSATLNFALPPAHSLITGTVYYSDGTVVANAWVNACHESVCAGATAANASGVYSVSVAPGTWTVFSTMSGYTLRETRRVTIGDYETIGGIDLVLLPDNAAVVGHVLDQYGAAVPGTRVFAADAATGFQVTPNAYADASGAYTVPIAAGTWRMIAMPPGYVRANQVITVTQGQTLTVDLTVHLRDVTIRGTVRDDHGVPLAAASVGTGQPDWGTSATTDASGAYTLSVYGGTWSINASMPGYTRARQSVTAANGQTLTGIDFTLIALNATIQGTVRDGSTNLPVVSATVSLGTPAWGTSVSTDAYGAYTVTIYSGTWMMAAWKLGYLVSYQQVTVAEYEIRTGVDFTLTVAHSVITGTARFGDTGNPVPNLSVNGTEQTLGLDARGITDGSGVYTMSVTPGTWVLNARPSNYTLASTPVVSISDYQTIGGIDLTLLRNDVTVTGHLRDSRGNPVAGAPVWPEDVNTGLQVAAAAFADASGSYTLPVAAGSWRVSAGGTGPGRLGGTYVKATQYVTVTSGQTLAGVDLTLYEVVHAGFDATPISGYAPLTVTFSNLSTGDYASSTWAFGDGATSVLSSPVHVYTSAGVYSVTLIVSGPGGTDTVTKTSYITVSVDPRYVDLVLNPGTATLVVGQIFTTGIEVHTGSGKVNAIAAYLDFDPSVLQIVNSAGDPTDVIENPGTPLNIELLNVVDNVKGTIDYSVGTFSSAQGNFVAGVLRFKALRDIAGTDVPFIFDAEHNRQTEATYGLGSVLRNATGGHYVVVNGVISGTVTLQGREVTPPADPYSIPLRVQLFAPGNPNPVVSTTVSTDRNAQFSLAGVVSGTYTMTVKNKHTLANQRANVVVGSGVTMVNMCTLLEGDSDDNSQVNVVDFSILATTFGKSRGQGGFDARADYNESGQVNIMDFSLLATNFGKYGTQTCTG